jgi:RNA polymerase sigma-32 factor
MGLPAVPDSLQRYLTDVNRYPVLSREEEFGIAERYFKERGLDDAHRLVTANLRYVVKIALGYRNYGCRLGDLIQEGNIGLMVAVKKFNPHKGYRLITYAAWWIRSYMQEFILKTRNIVRRGTKALKKRLFYRGVAAPDDDVSRDAVSTRNAEAPVDMPDPGGDLSLNSPVGPLGEESLSTHQDMLRDMESDPVEEFSAREHGAMVKREVAQALDRLSHNERLVIERRHLSAEPESLQSIGDALGLTRERVRQIEGKALGKLRGALSTSLA